MLTKCIIHESDVTWASRRLKLPVPRLFVQKIFRLRWNKNKATHYWPFFEGNRPVTGGFPVFPSQCGKRFHIMTSTCSDSFVLCDYDIDVVKAYQSFTPGAFPSSWQQMLQSAWGKCWFIASYLLNH